MIKKQLFYEIISNSMLPTLDKGDRVLVGERAPSKIQVGDIVVIDSNFLLENDRDTILLSNLKGKPIIHRVIDKEKRNDKWFYKTKGDNSWRVDGALWVVRKTEDHLLIQYDESETILIPESKIIGVVLKKIPKDKSKCPHCGKIINPNSLNLEIPISVSRGHEDLLLSLNKFELKILLNGKKHENL